MAGSQSETAEGKRLEESQSRSVHWKRWGPYLSERQWGTVREDYSEFGTAWDYFPHDHARSRVYRWGEDGILGISDNHQRLCLALAMWNGRDPILKERMFGLTNGEGNHGEDVKELYWYSDALPSHSWLEMLYKYPQAAFPYAWLVEENRRRGKDKPEFELLDTGVFDADRYFDVFVEYAKAGADDVLIRVTAHNRGPAPAPGGAAPLHVIPQAWFRNTWAWMQSAERPGHGIVLHRRGHHPVAGLQQAEQGEVEGFGSVGGEGDAGRIGKAQQPGHGFPGFEDDASGLQGPAMAAAARTGADAAQRLIDRGVDGFRLGKRGSSVVQIYGHESADYLGNRRGRDENRRGSAAWECRKLASFLAFGNLILPSRRSRRNAAGAGITPFARGRFSRRGSGKKGRQERERRTRAVRN